MPTIPKLKSKRKYRPPLGKRAERAKAYNNSQWRKVRQMKIEQNPVCEMCLDKDTINIDDSFTSKVNADRLEVHHLKSPFDRGISQDEYYNRLTDLNNLKTLCHFHHMLLHGLVDKHYLKLQEEHNKKIKNIDKNESNNKSK